MDQRTDFDGDAALDGYPSCQQATISRRAFTRSILGIAAMGLLVACDGDDDDGEADVATTPTEVEQVTATTTEPPVSAAEPTQAATTSDDEASTSGETRQFEHALGTSEIPTAPQRIATLNPVAFDAAIQLGNTPVTSVSNVGSLLDDRLSDLELVLEPSEPDLEAVAAIGPDLILTISMDGQAIPERVTELEAIAPVVAYDFESSAFWQDALLFFADALNKTDEGEQVLADYEQRVEELKQTIGDDAANIKVRVLRVRSGDGLGIYLRDSFPGTVLDAVGFGVPDGEAAEGFAEYLSLERIGEVDADHIFVWSFGATPELVDADRKFLEEEVLDSPLWEQLEAVQAGHVYFVGDYWIGSGTFAANKIVDDLFTYLVGEE